MNKSKNYAFNIFKQLTLRKPFIYEIKKKFYYIGYLKCRECTEEETVLYCAFLKCYKKNLRFSDGDQRKINAEFAKELYDIISEIYMLDGEKTEDNYKVKLKDLLCSIDKSELEDLESQMSIYTDSMRYFSAAETNVFLEKQYGRNILK